MLRGSKRRSDAGNVGNNILFPTRDNLAANGMPIVAALINSLALVPFRL